MIYLYYLPLKFFTIGVHYSALIITRLLIMAAKRVRLTGVQPNRPLGGDEDSSEDDDMPYLARQEARGGGPDSDGSE